MKHILTLLAGILFLLPTLGSAQTTPATQTIDERLVSKLDLNQAQIDQIKQIRIQERGNVLYVWRDGNIDADDKGKVLDKVRFAADLQVNKVLYPEQRITLQELRDEAANRYAYSTYNDSARASGNHTQVYSTSPQRIPNS